MHPLSRFVFYNQILPFIFILKQILIEMYGICDVAYSNEE